MSISLLATHIWIGFWDGVKALLKKLFFIKKKNIRWHTLDTEETLKHVNDVKHAKTSLHENEDLF